MRRLVISEEARADLGQIASFTSQEWGERQQSRYLSAIRRRLAELRRRPELGRPRNEVVVGSRSILAGRHVIFYAVTLDAVEVIRVLHDSMDVHTHVPAGPG